LLHAQLSAPVACQKPVERAYPVIAGAIDGRGNHLFQYVLFYFSFKCLKILDKEKKTGSG
jgi:hypothetical protein